MTAQETAPREAFHEALRAHYNTLAGSGTLLRFKEQSWQRFQGLGLPTRKNEQYRALKLRHLYEQAFHPALPEHGMTASVQRHMLSECSGSCLVFVNGYYRPELSSTAALPSNCVAIPISEAIRAYGSFFQSHVARVLKEEADPFAALNGALCTSGAFVYLPPKTQTEAPLQILHLVDAGKPLHCTPRIVLFAGTRTEIAIVSTHAASTKETYLYNAVADFVLEEGANVTYNQMHELPESPAWVFDATRAVLKRDCTFDTVAFTNGGASLRHDYRVQLAGENAEALLHGVWMLAGKREAHTHVLVDHRAPHCRSRQLFKGVLSDYSRSSFEGKILVRQEAQKTDAFQLNNNLLLSSQANADSKPNLEIFADDVKASHGATVGQPDPEQLFYMRARGYSDAAAKNLLVAGFCKEVLDMMTTPSLAMRAQKAMEEYLPL